MGHPQFCDGLKGGPPAHLWTPTLRAKHARKMGHPAELRSPYGKLFPSLSGKPFGITLPYMLLALLESATQLPTPTSVPSSAQDDLVRGLAAGALGLIGTVVTLLYGWIKDRDILATRTRQLDEASRRVSFWENWYKAILPLDAGDDSPGWRERARNEMWLASLTIERLFNQEAQKTTTQLPRWRRLLLFYRPPRSRAWFPRVIFYTYFFFFPISIPFQIHFQNVRSDEYISYEEGKLKELQADKSAGPEVVREREELQARVGFEKSRQSMGGARGIVLYVVFAGLFSMAFSLLFRWWSVNLEKAPNLAGAKKPT